MTFGSNKISNRTIILNKVSVELFPINVFFAYVFMTVRRKKDGISKALANNKRC